MDTLSCDFCGKEDKCVHRLNAWNTLNVCNACETEMDNTDWDEVKGFPRLGFTNEESDRY